MGEWHVWDFTIFLPNWMLIVLAFSLVGTALSLWLQR
jgi:hypothetical protein